MWCSFEILSLYINEIYFTLECHYLSEQDRCHTLQFYFVKEMYYPILSNARVQYSTNFEYGTKNFMRERRWATFILARRIYNSWIIEFGGSQKIR